jgi:hypothetical protein
MAQPGCTKGQTHITKSNPENQSFLPLGGLPVDRYQTAVRQLNGGPHHTPTYLLCTSLPGPGVLDTTPGMYHVCSSRKLEGGEVMEGA